MGLHSEGAIIGKILCLRSGGLIFGKAYLFIYIGWGGGGGEGLLSEFWGIWDDLKPDLSFHTVQMAGLDLRLVSLEGDSLLSEFYGRIQKVHFLDREKLWHAGVCAQFLIRVASFKIYISVS